MLRREILNLRSSEIARNVYFLSSKFSKKATKFDRDFDLILLEQSLDQLLFCRYFVDTIFVILANRLLLAINTQNHCPYGAYNHTTMNTPIFVRSPKLSIVGQGQYLDG